LPAGVNSPAGIFSLLPHKIPEFTIMSQKRFSFFAIVTIFVLIFSLVNAGIALADDETPPPAATGEPVQPPEEQPGGEPTEVPAAEPAPADETSPVETPTEEAATLAEVAEELPEGTDIVLLNEDGAVEPLVTEEAADLFVNGDPMWCPTGVLPGGAGCTSAYTSFTDLITELTSFPGSYTGAGTIYVAWDYDATVTTDSGTDIIFDYGDVALTSLVFQGGWDFGSNAVVGTSDLTGINSLQFWDWGAFGAPGSLTLNDIILTGGDGLYIGDDSDTTTANVVLDDVIVNNTNFGTSIGTDGTVSVMDSTFNNNDSDGLYVEAGSDITLNDVTARRNGGDGAYLDICGCTGGDITLTGTNEFINNDGDGLEAYTNGDISLNNVTANRNGDNGGSLFGGGDITLTGTSEFNNNDDYGLYVVSMGDITLHNVQANRNDDGSGAYLDNSAGSGDITLTGTNEFNNNDDYGLEVLAADDIQINNITANRNGEDGANLETCGCTGDSDITLTGTNEFNNNDGYGLYAGTDGNIFISNITANRNDYDGAYLGGSGDLKLTGTNEFNNNDGAGLYVEMGGDVTLFNVTAYYNYYNGAWIDNTYGTGNVSIYNSNFDYNVEDLADGYAGLNVDSNGFVTLSNVSASNNGGDGADVGYYTGGWTGVTVVNSVFNDNYDLAGDGWGYGLWLDNGNGNVVIANVTGQDNEYNGLYINTTGNVTINNSDFSDNYDDDGAELEVDGNVLICNSAFSDNDLYGLDAGNVDGDLTLSDVTFGGNGSGDYTYGGSGTLSVTSGVNCIPAGGKKSATGGLPLHLVPVNEGDGPVDLDCELYSGTMLILSNGDSVTFKCSIVGSATLNRLTGDGLPGDLPEGVEFFSGMGAGHSPDGSNTALDGLVVVSFVIPDDSASFAILYWNGSEWVDLKDASFEDGREVVNGGVKTGDGHFQAITNFSGTFVLVTK
jgi:hypothetical protein